MNILSKVIRGPKVLNVQQYFKVHTYFIKHRIFKSSYKIPIFETKVPTTMFFNGSELPEECMAAGPSITFMPGFVPSVHSRYLRTPRESDIDRVNGREMGDAG